MREVEFRTIDRLFIKMSINDKIVGHFPSVPSDFNFSGRQPLFQ